ncbi:MAG TPA: TIGR03435 family protein [Candidatus Acidoferrales bacterium]|nr:TIGR03435 family protein [Candidatus Acidoferrales bacterium]
MKRALALVGLLAFASCGAFAQAPANTAATSSATPAAATPASFEIADVHKSSATPFPFFQGAVVRGGKYTLKQATMVDLIATAYGVTNERVLGGPSWLETDRFDVIAKVPGGTKDDAAKAMLQGMLAERFKLTFHNDTHPMPVFALSAGKGKPKLKESDGSGTPGCVPQIPQTAPNEPPTYITAVCHNMTMEALATTLRQFAGGYLSNPVVDQTGLKGNWDFEFKWSPRGQLAAQGADGISIFDAMDKQLGLKLEPQNIPQPVMVVDSVNEKPTDNSPEVAKVFPASTVPSEFEVAVIKPSMPGANLNGRVDPGGQISLQAFTLKILMQIAWNLNPNESQSIVNAPKFLDSNKFDIIAKASTVETASNAAQIDFDELRMMLQALLKDRFKLAVHTEDREINAYSLIAASPKMKKADPTERATCKEGPGPDGKDPRIANPILSRLVTCQNMTMAEFANRLQLLAGGYIYSPVEDATGLQGAWDFTLSFSPINAVNGGGRGGAPTGDAAAAGGGGGGAGVASDPNGALSLMDAMNKQLGIKMEMRKRKLPVLVIDHVEEKPTDN